jgi:hypothetical protein
MDEEFSLKKFLKKPMHEMTISDSLILQASGFVMIIVIEFTLETMAKALLLMVSQKNHTI